MQSILFCYGSSNRLGGLEIKGWNQKWPHLPSLSGTHLGDCTSNSTTQGFVTLEVLLSRLRILPFGNMVTQLKYINLWLTPEHFRFCAEISACKQSSHYMTSAIDPVHQEQVWLLFHNMRKLRLVAR